MAMLGKFLVFFVLLTSTMMKTGSGANHVMLDANKRQEVFLHYNTRLDGHKHYRAGNLSGYAFQ